ncbi:sulfotransferase domain-containing protein [Pelagicoccus sp. SDUM812002]|uniref:sulfotransferase domain-containing protein n=1 Tax=Pelagicoccus sp. SDUM812002 TaxID=3041266 RepID=UPI00280E3406|nr:sulfotransferase domain-containing protein [Pelagicoccus sp. SDUM812002]MDQ8188167.1 hypothetical protein [Pelagicoccus sp. SDUM812002]
MKKPNLFIVGAPKCGTTSLANWLAGHSSVFISDPKEPEYWDFDRKKGWSSDINRYESYFDNADERHDIVCDASTAYLRSKVAVKHIVEYSPTAKFIVGLRNPVDLAYSWHGELLVEGCENVRDFETAWNLQGCRLAGHEIPRFCPDSSNLLYGEVARLGAQLRSLKEHVHEDRLFVYTLDEMKKDPNALWCQLLGFLELTPSYVPDFEVANRARSVPSWISIGVRVVADTKRRIGFSKGLGILNGLARISSRERRTVFPPSLRQKLTLHFREDLELLSEVSGKDLSGWEGKY